MMTKGYILLMSVSEEEGDKVRYYGVATRGIVLGDRGDRGDANALSDLLRRPKSPSQFLIVRCRPSAGRASPSVVEDSGNRKRVMPATQ